MKSLGVSPKLDGQSFRLWIAIAALVALRPSSAAAQGWTSAQNLGGPNVGDPSCVVAYPGIVDCFAVADDSTLRQSRWSLNQGSGWYNLGSAGSEAFYEPSCVALPETHQIHCFVFAGSSQLWHRWWDANQWRRWESLGTPTYPDGSDQPRFPSDTTPSCLAAGQRVHCFIIGADAALWHRWWDGGSWGDWESLGGVIVGNRLACLSRDPDHIDCFVHGTDSAMWHRWWDGVSWNGWESLGAPGGVLEGDISCVSSSPDRIDCFAPGPVGNDVGLYSISWGNGGWAPWHSRGGPFVLNPSCVSAAPGRVHCSALEGFDQFAPVVARQWYTQSSVGWTRVGSALGGAVHVACAVPVTNRVDCFFDGAPNGLAHFSWTP
jgi:hypothetical protein